MTHLPPAKRHPYDQWSPDARALDLVGDKWTLLIVRDLMSGPRRFVELQRVLPGISTEQLRSRLNRMVADGMLTRQRYREVPPRVDYELTERARELAPVLGALAHWGFDWTWSAPRPSEQIDVSALFRLLPGLIDAGIPHGTLGLTVRDGRDEAPQFAALVVDADGVHLTEPAAPPTADAHLEGSTAQWIAALGPGGDPGALEVRGAHVIAGAVLGVLRRGAVAPATLPAAADAV